MNNYEKHTIRSITYSIDLNKISDNNYLDKVKADFSVLTECFEDHGYRIRTLRINIKVIIDKERLSPFVFVNRILKLSVFCRELGVRWFNIGFDLTGVADKEVVNLCNIGFEIIRKYNNSFVNFIVARNGEINPFAAIKTAEVISRISRLSGNGFDNFRVGVSLNPSPGTPFFPFSFSEHDKCFSIAFESAQIVLAALKGGTFATLEDKRNVLLDALGTPVGVLDQLSRGIEQKHGLRYNGIDFSLAPYPDEKVSVIEILDLLGLESIGSAGTMFMTSFLTDILKAIIIKENVRPAGFNGVMYSLLEDHLMCAANNRKMLSIDSILAYSTMCGCGLDMVPIPGNFFEEELSSIILDVAAIAIRLNKPLGVRVLPIPSRDANEYTMFESDFLSNTRILPLKNYFCRADVFKCGTFKYKKNQE